MRVAKLTDLTNSQQVIGLSGLRGYKKFKVNENLFVHVTEAQTIGPEWNWYRPYSPTISMNLSYDSETGELTIPAAWTGDIYIEGNDAGDYGYYSMKLIGAVYLIY